MIQVDCSGDEDRLIDCIYLTDLTIYIPVVDSWIKCDMLEQSSKTGRGPAFPIIITVVVIICICTCVVLIIVAFVLCKHKRWTYYTSDG